MKRFLIALARQLWLFFGDYRNGFDLSPSKSFTTLFCAVFTYKMLHHLPDDWVLWLVYGGCVGGIEVAKKAISARFAAQTPAEPQS